MTVARLGDQVPRISPAAWVSEAAYVVGDVELGEGSSVWPGAVIRGDFGHIRIGRNTAIEDNCVLHAGESLKIGDDTIVGHSVVVHCALVGSNCLIGNHATLLDGSIIGDYCMVASGAVLLGGIVVPDRSFIVGVPARIEPLTATHLLRLERQGRSNAELGTGKMARLYGESGL